MAPILAAKPALYLLHAGSAYSRLIITAKHAIRHTMGLLDLPDELVSRCVSALEYGDISSLVACLSTCKKLLHLVLQQRSFWLLVELEEGETKRTLLQLIPASLLRKVKIILRSQSVQHPTEEQLRSFLASTATGSSPGSLAGITELCIERGSPRNSDLSLDKLPWLQLPLLPDCVSRACPGLHHLTLRGITAGHQHRQSGEQWPTVPCQLQRLTLQHFRLVMSPWSLERQLWALPSIQQFECSDLLDKKALQPYHISSIAGTLSRQLTAVAFHGESMYPPSFDHGRLLSVPYPSLRTLDIRTVVVDDDSLDAILQHAPALQHVRVSGFHLQRYHNHATCWWETVCTQACVNPKSMGMLPLRDSMQLQVAGKACCLQYLNEGALLDDLATTVEGVAAIQRCGGLRGYGGHSIQSVHLDWSDYEHNPTDWVWETFFVCMPLWVNIPRIVLTEFPVTRQLLTTVGELPACTHVSMRICTVEDDLWPEIIALLPRVQVLQLSHRDRSFGHPTFRQVLTMCHAANRAFRLEVVPGLFTDASLDQAFIDAVEVACPHVQLEVVDQE